MKVKVSVDIIILTVKEQRIHVLLNQLEGTQWALVGGSINPKKDDDLATTAKRYIMQQTGVNADYLEQVETVGNVTRDPRGWSISVSYFALLANDKLTRQGTWLPIDKLSVPLTLDHKHLLESCVSRIRNKVLYTALPLYFMPSEFTLVELQKAYEAILGKSVETKSFRRRMQNANILHETGEKRPGVSKPAKLYRASLTTHPHFFRRNFEGSRQN